MRTTRMSKADPSRSRARGPDDARRTRLARGWLARLVAVGLAVSLPGGFGSPAAAQDAPTCVPEVEPNDRLADAPSMAGDLCQTGRLEGDREQDLLLWEVAPEDGLTRWTFTVRGVPTTVTSIRVLHILPTAAANEVTVDDIGAEVTRVDSDAHPDTPPGTATLQLAPGRYLLGISRGTPSFGQAITADRDYRVSIVADRTLPASGDAEPNDDATSAHAVTGAFDLSGDLVSTEDHYRWTVSGAETAQLWRVEARSSMDAPLTLEIAEPGSPAPLAYGTAGPDGVVALHDLALAPGDYDVTLSPGAAAAQPYVLAAAPVTEGDVDSEPNDAPEQALPLAPDTPAHGRLTSDLDVDRYAFDVTSSFAGHLVDIDLSWPEGPVRQLCLSTDDGTRIGCLEGERHVTFAGMLLSASRYLLDITGKGDLADRYELSIAPGAALAPAAQPPPGPDAATASPVSGAFEVSGDLAGSTPGTGHVYAWTLSDADAALPWRLEVAATPGLPGRLDLLGSDGNGLASASLAQEGTARIWDLRLPAGTYTVWVTQSGGESPSYVLRSIEETAVDVDAEPNDVQPSALTLDPSTRHARGRIATRDDVDRYLYEVDDAMAAGLVELSLTWPGQGLYRLCLDTDYGSQVQCREARDGIVLSDLRLAPGVYGAEVSGNGDPDTRYDLEVRPGPAAAPDNEAEPNDLADAATGWDPVDVMHGRSFDGDIDTFRVPIAPGEPQLWRLDATGTDLGLPTWTQPDGTRVGLASVLDDGTAAVIEDLYLVEGDHLLTIPAGGEYTLTLTPLGPPDLAAEHEPNDDPDRATPLPMGGFRTGRLPSAEDIDLYRFSLAAPEHVVLSVEPPEDLAVGLEMHVRREHARHRARLRSRRPHRLRRPPAAERLRGAAATGEARAGGRQPAGAERGDVHGPSRTGRPIRPRRRWHVPDAAGHAGPGHDRD